MVMTGMAIMEQDTINMVVTRMVTTRMVMIRMAMIKKDMTEMG